LDYQSRATVYGHVRRIYYKIDRVWEYAHPSLGPVFLWFKDACEKLLSELKEKKADEKDLEYVDKEIEFLSGYQVDWKAKHEKRVTLISTF